MHARRKKMIISVSLILISSISIISLIMYSLRNNIDLFYLPKEVLHGKEDRQMLKPVAGQRLKVGGMVAVGSVNREIDSLKLSFKITDKSQSFVNIVYTGLLPDLFKEGKGVIVQGTLINENTVLASEVLAKHDENYVPRELKHLKK